MKKSLIGLMLMVAFSALASVPTPQYVLMMVNQYRAEHRLKPLIMDARITAEALQHSRAMANHRVGFGHQQFAQRVKHVCSSSMHCASVSENVAFNHTGAHGVLLQWIHSPLHRKNLLSATTLTGIGIAADNGGRIYYTEIFVKPGQP